GGDRGARARGAEARKEAVTARAILPTKRQGTWKMPSFRTTFLTILLVLGAATPVAAGEAADIAAIEAQREVLGKAYEDGDAAAARALMTPDQRSVTFVYDGPQTVDQQLASLKDLAVEVYDAIPPTFEMLGADAAL